MPRGRPHKDSLNSLNTVPKAFIHDSSTRIGLPAGGTAGKAAVPKSLKKKYWYNPHLSPVLRYDSTGKADRILALVEKAGHEPLTLEEKNLLEEALRNYQPWLEWSGKREAEEKGYFEVDPVALSIHERVSPQAILRAAKREDVQRDLFADPQEPWTEAVKFYRHDVEWANRLILGDSLQVMTSLAEREALAGKVQMIYIDPPYGISYKSNFQPFIGKRNVEEKEKDFTREQEQVKAYRDAWNVGIHSYVHYLRDRIIAAHDLLADTGSIFIQIGEENLHLAKNILDEKFGKDNHCRVIPYLTTSYQDDNILGNLVNYLVWYCKDKSKFINKVKRIYRSKELGDQEAAEYKWVMLPDGSSRSLSDIEYSGSKPLAEGSRVWRYGPLTSQGFSETGSKPVVFRYREYTCGQNQHWKTNIEGLKRLERAEQLIPRENSISNFLFLDYFSVSPIANTWMDTKWGFDASEKQYAVQTNTKVIERCLLMTTDPGDLVLDPTCGSGTTAYVAEQWGRRWITMDTSRVALAIARQRLMTARFENYKVKKPSGGTSENPGTGFNYKTVPHITLKSIAQNRNLDPIFERYEPLLDAALNTCNTALANVGMELKKKLEAKLTVKLRDEGKRTLTDADERRWKLKDKWEHWEVPFDTDEDWPKSLKDAVIAYRKTWRAKMDEVNACIAANADQEELVDQPETAPGVRVSGPFTVEGVLPVEYMRADESESRVRSESELAADQGISSGHMVTRGNTPAYGIDNDYNEEDEDADRNAEAYFDQMLRLLKLDGVTFKGNKVKKFAKLYPLWNEGRDIPWQAEGWWEGDDESLPAPVAIIFGPQYGSLTGMALEEAMQQAPRASYIEIVAAAFSFEPEASEIVADETSHARLLIHQTFIRPDVNPGMEGLLKDQPRSQLFTVFGKPEIRLSRSKEDDWTVALEGVDIYDPLTGDVHSTGASKVAAWFLDSDYDGRAFCITQAFFPDQDAWEKIRKALKTEADDYAFDTYKGTVSVPFKIGKYARIAVKVIDPRGNEVMVVKKLEGK